MDERAAGDAAPGAQRHELLGRLRIEPGLCAGCVHLQVLAARRSAFVRCGLAETDPRFPRYPRLPVLACAGYRAAPAEDAGG